MPAAPRISAATLFTPDQWAPFQRRSAWKGPLLVLHAWGVIALAIAVGVVWPIVIPFSVMIVGTRQLGLAILMHEAAHGALARSPRLNDGLGHWLCAVPIGASLHAYRPYHLSHHRFAQQAEDPDLVLSAPFPISPASLRRKIVRDLTGQTFFKQRIALPLAMRRSRVTAKRAATQGTAAQGTDHDYDAVVTGGSILPFVLVNLAMLTALGLAGVWWAYFALWLLPMATWFPLVTRIRNIAEHACVEGSATDPFRSARTTRAAWWERALIAPYWVNFHAEHHLFMFCSAPMLPKLHQALVAKGYGERMEIAPNYLSVIRQVTRQTSGSEA